MSQSCKEINRAITQETLWCTKVREEFGECVRYKPEEITYRQQYIDLYVASSPVSDKRPDLLLLFVKRGWWIPISLYIHLLVDGEELSPLMLTLLEAGLDVNMELIYSFLQIDRPVLAKTILERRSRVEVELGLNFADDQLSITRTMVITRLMDGLYRSLKTSGGSPSGFTMRGVERVYSVLSNTVLADRPKGRIDTCDPTIVTSPQALQNLNWLVDNGSLPQPDLYLTCIRLGKLDCVLFMEKHRLSWPSYSPSTLLALIEKGSLDVVKHLITKDGLERQEHSRFMSTALRCDHLELAIWMTQNRIVYSGEELEWAVENNRTEIVDWAASLGFVAGDRG